MIRGTILATMEMLFPAGIPSLKDFAQAEGVAPSTFRHSAEWLLGLLPGLFEARRPGPQAEEPLELEKRAEAVQQLEALRTWLLEKRSPTEKNHCYSPEAKQRIAAVVERIQDAGVMSFEEIAGTLQIDGRQLRRIREEVEKAGGEAPQPESRRPHSTGKLSPEIQRLIQNIQNSAKKRQPYGPMDVKRILEKNYKEDLKEHHGGESIALSTVTKYMAPGAAKAPAPEKHPRGSFVYPEPFQMVAVDTSHFKVFGRTFYLITVFEVGGRLNLLTRVFLREDTRAVAAVLEEFLLTFPGLEVVVIDRGTPYLNEEVKRLLEDHGRLRLVCPPATPTAKAACERHFLTLKEVLRPALERVFPEDPGWEPDKVVKVLEFGIAVFQDLYHRIPQEGIDGKSPAERAGEFDPVKACARMVDLFQRSLDSEPADEYARHLHQRFQLPGDPEETVKALEPFGTRCLRKLHRLVEPYMGPPFPDWIYDPLGYLASKARDIWKEDRAAFLAEKLRKAKEKEAQALARKEEEDRAAREKVEEQHPERLVDGALKTLGIALKIRAGIKRSARHLRDLLIVLSCQMKDAFLGEVERLRGRIQAITEDSRVRKGLERFLEEFVGEWMDREGFTGG
jgi:transposase-like protein